MPSTDWHCPSPRGAILADSIPRRFLWALDKLDVEPSEDKLEIGCGTGVLLYLVAEKLTSGTATVLDRSDKATMRAARRNAAAVATGKVRLITGLLADAPFGPTAFDRVFAFNVNVFWLQPEQELAVVRRILKPSGSLLLFYDPFGSAIGLYRRKASSPSGQRWLPCR